MDVAGSRGRGDGPGKCLASVWGFNINGQMRGVWLHAEKERKLKIFGVELSMALGLLSFER